VVSRDVSGASPVRGGTPDADTGGAAEAADAIADEGDAFLG